MAIKFLPMFILCVVIPAMSQGQEKQTTKQYQQDFEFFWTTINQEYCYFDKKQIDWLKVKEIYSPLIHNIDNRDQFVTILEKVLRETYDHHANLNTNTKLSHRLVPSGTDIWAEYVGNKAIITEVRGNFGPEKVGIVAGMEIIAVNDILIKSAIEPFVPKTLKSNDNEAMNFALRTSLAGNHVQPRKFTLAYNGKAKDYYPDEMGMLLENNRHSSLAESRIVNEIGYIKINDCLFDNRLITAFDSIMNGMQRTQSVILDLRDTPSGGNSSVAKTILSWFITKEQFYQRHEYYAEEKYSGIKRSWVEIVSPRKGKYYDKPLVILCNHWTGSMGEGITIAFDGLNRINTQIMGTEMARLNGAVNTFEMPNTKMHFSFPTERLYHINGKPREQYVPSILVEVSNGDQSTHTDVILQRAMEYLGKK